MNREAAMRQVNTLTQCIAANATVARAEFKPGNPVALEQSVKALKAMVANIDALGGLINDAAFDCPDTELHLTTEGAEDAEPLRFPDDLANPPAAQALSSNDGGVKA